MGVPVKRGRTKMVLNLRSLALLTGSFTEVRSCFTMKAIVIDNYEPNNQGAAIERAKPKVSKPTAMMSVVKRRIGYDSEEEEVHELRKGIVNIAMNDVQET